LQFFKFYLTHFLWEEKNKHTVRTIHFSCNTLLFAAIEEEKGCAYMNKQAFKTHGAEM